MGIVFDIQRFSIHDGPGIRSTVFLKGCNNNCLWCHNPESIKISPEIQTYYDKCIGCGKCYEVCPRACHTIFIDEENNTKRVFDRKKCNGCGLCADNCFAGAIVLCGEEKSVEEVIEQVLMDKVYYDQSGGGVTISGGEPFLQFEFLMQLLERLKENNIHTILQTALNINFDLFLRVAPFVDLFMCDLKVFDEQLHKEYIGNSGHLIKNNIKRLCELEQYGTTYAIRTPVIGGVNDSEEEIGNITNFIYKYSQPEYYELMPYHNLGISKMETLGIAESEQGEIMFFKTPDEEKMVVLNRLIKRGGQHE